MPLSWCIRLNIIVCITAVGGTNVSWLDAWRSTGILGGGAPLPSALSSLHTSHGLHSSLHTSGHAPSHSHAQSQSHALASITNTDLSRPTLLAAAVASECYLWFYFLILIFISLWVSAFYVMGIFMILQINFIS